jgi:hypothetical protein
MQWCPLPVVLGARVGALLLDEVLDQGRVGILPIPRTSDVKRRLTILVEHLAGQFTGCVVQLFPHPPPNIKVGRIRFGLPTDPTPVTTGGPRRGKGATHLDEFLEVVDASLLEYLVDGSEGAFLFGICRRH